MVVGKMELLVLVVVGGGCGWRRLAVGLLPLLVVGVVVGIVVVWMMIWLG